MKLLLSTGCIASVLLLAGCASASPAPQPTATALAQAASEAAYERLVADQKEQLLSAHPDAVVPETSMVRQVLPEEWGQAIADCMVDQGYKVVADPDGGIRAEPVAIQQSMAQAVALYVCQVEYPVDARFTAPLDSTQQRYLYDYFVNDLVPCLSGHGYPTSRAPSWSVFAETYSSSPWSPYSEVPPGTEEEWAAINEACPQQPEGLYG